MPGITTANKNSVGSSREDVFCFIGAITIETLNHLYSTLLLLLCYYILFYTIEKSTDLSSLSR